MKWQDGIDTEIANNIIDGALKTVISKHDLEDEKIVKILERLQNMSPESIQRVAEYGDILDAFDAYIDEKMDESEQDEFLRKQDVPWDQIQKK